MKARDSSEKSIQKIQNYVCNLEMMQVSLKPFSRTMMQIETSFLLLSVNIFLNSLRGHELL